MLWKDSALFRGIDVSSANELAAVVRKKSYKKDDTIFFHEDEGRFFYIIGSGQVKLGRGTQHGIESVTMILGEGDVLGENLLFGEADYTYSATALSETCLFAFSVPELRMIMRASGVIMDNAAQIILGRNRILQKELEHIKVQTAPQRIGCFLLDNCHASSGRANFELPYEKSLIASKLGMKPETLSRALAELKNQGVQVDGKMVTIADIRKLADFTCTACSDYFPCKKQSNK